MQIHTVPLLPLSSISVYRPSVNGFTEIRAYKVAFAVAVRINNPAGEGCKVRLLRRRIWKRKAGVWVLPRKKAFGYPNAMLAKPVPSRKAKASPCLRAGFGRQKDAPAPCSRRDSNRNPPRNKPLCAGIPIGILTAEIAHAGCHTAPAERPAFAPAAGAAGRGARGWPMRRCRFDRQGKHYQQTSLPWQIARLCGSFLDRKNTFLCLAGACFSFAV